MCTREALGEHARAQAEGRVVGHTDRFFLGLERDERHDRTEELLTSGGDGLVRAAEDCGGVVVAVVKPFGPLPAGVQRCALCDGFGDDAFDVVALGGRGERADLGVGVEGIADTDGFGAFDELGQELVVDALLHEDPGSGDAALASGAEVAGDGAVHSAFQIGVLKDEDG